MESEPQAKPCHVCGGVKPYHEQGCWEAPDFGPSYRYDPEKYR